MSEIKITDIQDLNPAIKDLNPAGSDFFADVEGFIDELSEEDLNVWGGAGGGNPKTLSLYTKLTLSK